MNFMDYCDDEATFMFTKDQVYKMHVATQLWRPEMLENRGPQGSAPYPDPGTEPGTNPEPQEPSPNPVILNPPAPVNPQIPELPYPENIEKVLKFNSGWKLSGDASYKNMGGMVLKTKNKGSGTMSIALPAGNYQLTLNARVKNPKTYITVDGLTIKVPMSDDYQRITFEFRNKKDSINITVGTTSADKTTLFEEIVIKSGA